MTTRSFHDWWEFDDFSLVRETKSICETGQEVPGGEILDKKINYLFYYKNRQPVSFVREWFNK